MLSVSWNLLNKIKIYVLEKDGCRRSFDGYKAIHIHAGNIGKENNLIIWVKYHAVTYSKSMKIGNFYQLGIFILVFSSFFGKRNGVYGFARVSLKISMLWNSTVRQINPIRFLNASVSWYFKVELGAKENY